MVVFEMNHDEVLQNKSKKGKMLETSKKDIYSVLHYINH